VTPCVDAAPPPERRLVGRTDAPALALVHAGCFDEPWSATAIIEVLAMPGAFGFATVFSGLPPAAFALARVNADEAELLTLAVGAPWRRHGLARDLIDAVARHAAARLLRPARRTGRRCPDPAARPRPCGSMVRLCLRPGVLL
jgi:ribosomal protein S18 acetylase RimI-like enzyme